MAESKMPARIWCDRVDADMCRKQFRPDDTTYIRADLVEQRERVLVEALRSAQRIIERDFPNGQLAMDIRAALSSWEAAQ